MSELERWEERFSSPDYVFGTEPNAFLKKQAARFKRGQLALSLADGEGRNGVWLAEQGLDVLSLDASSIAQEKARRLAAKRGVQLAFELADLADWAWPEARFDLVVGIFIQFAGPELRARIFDGMRRALKPGGLLLLEGYRPEQLVYRTGGPSAVENLYTEALLREAFGDFAILQLDAYDAAIEEGAGHAGASALIDLVAQKPAA